MGFFRWMVLWFLSACVIAGCAPGTPAPPPGLSQSEAIAAALKTAANSRPEMSGAQGTPTNVRAERLSLEEAVRRFDATISLPPRYAANAPVWLVSMDGLWLSLAVAPLSTGSPTQVPYRHFAVILDAMTGMEIEVWANP